MNNQQKTTFKKIALFGILTFLSLNIYSQDISNLELKNSQSILNDRIYLNFPDSAKNIARAVDIMSHDHNIEKETRIVFDNGEERLVFFAQELFSLGNANLLASMSKYKEDNFAFEFSQLINEKGFEAVQSLPTKWKENRGGILINSLTVMTKDSTLIRIDAYINPEAFKAQKEKYIALSQRVFKTLQPGKRFNALNARKEKVNIFGTKKAFEISIPKNATIQVDQKYDFQVIRIIYYTKLEDTTWKSVSIYTGHHPSYFYPDYGFSDVTSKPKTTFLGKTTDWLYFENLEEHLFLKEQKIDCSEIEDGMVVHIALSGNQADIITELTTLVEGIQLK